MANRAPDLVAVAEALADGTPVDWEALESLTPTPEVRQQLSGLRAVGRIIDAYRTESAAEPTAASSDVAARLPPGARWGSLRIAEHLGSGTFGDVYRAHDLRLDRAVALKLLHGRDGVDDDLQSTVVREGRLLARVRHPNVATVYGADCVDGRVGVWMELVEGRSLGEELAERGSFPASEVSAIGADLCGALAAVHDAGVLHRDVKAQNVMRDERSGRVVLTDFSAGRESAEPGDGDAGLPGTLAGSPIYLAPEILDGQRASPRSDVYSLGVLLFRLVSGRFPVDGSSIAEIRNAHLAGRRATLGELCPGLSVAVSAPIERAIRADPRERFASARDMELALRVTPRRRRWPWAIVAGLAVALAGGLVTALVGRPRTPPLPFAERDWVLIAAFDNRTGDAAFDDVLERALARELAGSGFVNVVPRPRVDDALGLMKQPLDRRLDPRLAREVSMRDGGIRAVLTGHLDRVGSAYALTTQIVNPSDGMTVATVSDDVAASADLLAGIRTQAWRVRRTLGETLPSIAPGQALERVTTPSLPALQLYSKAAALLEGEYWQASGEANGRFQSAEGLLKQATDLDQSFALAWLLRAHAACRGDGVQTTADCLPLAERALQGAETASVPERYFIEGYVSRRRWAAAPGRRDQLMASARAYEALLQLAPDHHWALLELESVYQHLGRLEDAGRTTLRAAAMRPLSIRFAIDSARVHLRERDQPALEAAAARALTRVSGGAEHVVGVAAEDITWMRLWRAHDAWLNGDPANALAAARHAEQAGPGNARIWLYQLSQLYQGLGRFDDAVRLSAQMDPDFALTTRVLVAARREDWSEMRRLVKPDPLRHLGALTFAGMTDEAERALAARRRGGDRLPWQFNADFVGQLRVAQGRFAEGLTLLEPLTQPQPRPRYKVFEAAAIARRAMGDTRGAIALLEPLGPARAAVVSYVWSASDWLRCRTLLAELYDQVGRIADGDAVDADVRRLLGVADPGHPMIRRLDARRR